MDTFWKEETVNNPTYQFFAKMDNEQLLSWMNTVAVTAEHQDEIAIITVILVERGYGLVDVPGGHGPEHYTLEPLAKQEGHES